MSRVEAAAADRLPWLPDEPQPQPAIRRRGQSVWHGAAAAVAADRRGPAIGIGTAKRWSSRGALPTMRLASATVQLPHGRRRRAVRLRRPARSQAGRALPKSSRRRPARSEVVRRPQAPAAKVEGEAHRATESRGQAEAAPAAVTAPRCRAQAVEPARVFAGAAGRARPGRRIRHRSARPSAAGGTWSAPIRRMSDLPAVVPAEPDCAAAAPLPLPDRDHVAGPFRGAVPAHGAHPLQLRRGRPAVEGEGRAVSDDRAYDEPLPWLQAVEDEDEPRGLSARKMLAALVVVLLAALIVAGDLLLARPARRRR